MPINLHPILTDFPIVITVFIFFMEIFVFFNYSQKELIKKFLVILSVCGLIITIIIVVFIHPFIIDFKFDEAKILYNNHQNAAWLLTILYLLYTWLILFINFRQPENSLLLKNIRIVLATLLISCLIYTARAGGRMVFEFGIGVMVH